MTEEQLKKWHEWMKQQEKSNEYEELSEEEIQNGSGTKQFYEDSTTFRKHKNGLAIIIMDNVEERRLAVSWEMHIEAVEKILNSFGIKDKLSSIDGDFGAIIAKKYHCVFIRAAAADKYSLVYVPDDCTDFQVERLKKFNDDVKEFNSTREGQYAVNLCYLLNDEENDCHNLDRLIDYLEKKKSSHR